MATREVGDVVYARLQGQTGVILGPSENPLHAGAEEAVVRVRLLDGQVIDAGVSSLGDVEREKKAEEVEEAAAAEPVAAPEPPKSDAKSVAKSGGKASKENT